LVHFFRRWYHVPRKIWQPCFGQPALLFPCLWSNFSGQKNMFEYIFTTEPKV
jgi:hypothetical protein